jgi:hypothetical protein
VPFSVKIFRHLFNCNTNKNTTKYLLVLIAQRFKFKSLFEVKVFELLCLVEKILSILVVPEAYVDVCEFVVGVSGNVVELQVLHVVVAHLDAFREKFEGIFDVLQHFVARTADEEGQTSYRLTFARRLTNGDNCLQVRSITTAEQIPQVNHLEAQQLPVRGMPWLNGHEKVASISNKSLDDAILL